MNADQRTILRRAVAVAVMGAILCVIAEFSYWEWSSHLAAKGPQAVDVPVAMPADVGPPQTLAVPEEVAEAASQVQPIRIAPQDTPSPASAVGALPPQLRVGLDDLQRMASSDPALVAWLADWKSTVRSGRAVSQEEIDRLKAILKSTNLSCQKLVALGNALQFYSGDELAGVFFAAAAVRGDQELVGYEPGSPKAKPLVRTMIGTLEVLWRLIDDKHELDFVPAVALIDKDTVHWVSANDADLMNARQHAKIGIAECSYLMGKTGEALRETRAIDIAGMTADQREGVAWIYSLVLRKAGRYAEAAEQTKVCAADPGFSYAERASIDLFLDLILLDQNDAARQTYLTYRSRYGENHTSRYMAGLLQSKAMAEKAKLDAQ